MAQIAARKNSIPSVQQQPAQYELGIPLPANEGLGFQLGWDYAHHGLTPPVEHLFTGSPLRQGWQAGQATFGKRTLRARRHTQLWLRLRTHAWARGRSFEDVQLTPNYFQQIEVSHCPITRQALNERHGDASERSVDRVRNDAGYAAGNLALMSRTANAAKASHGYEQLQEITRSVTQGPIQQIAGLGPLEWQRLSVLSSFVTELPHEQAAQIPLVVMPPNRLRLFNPIQALQALVTRQLMTPGWSQRLSRVEALLPSDSLKGDFNRFVLALAPRVLAAKKLTEAHDIRWALEDAWTQPLLQKRWSRFALQLDAGQAEALVQRMAAKRLVPVQVQKHEARHATEGWALEKKGFAEVSLAGRR